MPKLNSFKVRIETGDSGFPGPVLFNINSHHIPFEKAQGAPSPGAVFAGEFEVGSYAHALTVVGPPQGSADKWHIKKLTVDFDCEGAAPYSVTYGEVTLDETTEVNIWKDPPGPVFDV